MVYTFPVKFGHDVDRVISFPAVYCTSKSIQPFRKYSRLKLAHLRQSAGCTKISGKSNYAPISKTFSQISSRHMCKQLCRWKLFIRKTSLQSFILWSGKTHFFAFFSCFRPPKWGKESSWGADFGVVGKPIHTFLIAVHWSHFDVSVHFLTNRLNIVKKRDVRRGSLRR